MNISEIEQVVDYIPNLPPKKRHNIKRTSKIIMVLAVLIVSTTLVSAALLTYFGQIQTTANVQQAVVISADGTNWNTYDQPITHTISEPAPGGETFCFEQWIWNKASIPVAVTFNTNLYDGITTTCTLVHEITDDNTNFGSSDNEVVAFSPPAGLTLDGLFVGAGLSYTYTIINGGTWAGASPVVAVIDLADGRHVVLFPGWGARTSSQSLQFSDTVATCTVDVGGPAVVDFTVYTSNFAGGAQWSSNNQYGNWNYLKASGSSTGGVLPLTGNEYVTRIAIMHQGANTGETDRINSLTFSGTTYNFVDGKLQPGEILPFRICYAFDLHIGPGTYVI